MRKDSKYSLLILLSAVSFFLALNPLKIEPKLIFLFAAVIVITISFIRNWINGVFVSLFFNFAYYSINPLDTGVFALDTAVFIAFSVMGDKVKMFMRHEAKAVSNVQEKIFLNKIVNSLMFAHDMLWEIKKGLGKDEIQKIFSKNIMNLIGVKHVVIYKDDGSGSFELEFSFGKCSKDAFAKSVKENEFEGRFLKNSGTSEIRCMKKSKIENCAMIPLRDDEGLKEVVILLREKQFDHSDIYIVEFFAAQIFVILEKQDLFQQLRDNYEKIIEALSIAIDTKDHETHGHSMATMSYAMKLADKIKLSDVEKEKIKYASLLHDIGKINISSRILNKPDKLTSEEFDIIKKHPAEGVSILNKLNIFDEILPIILYHHEHYDGRGYPYQLKGDEIPLGSRITSIADAYSVMRSDRPYRKALKKQDAIEELKKCSGTQFDKELVKAFLEIIENEEDDADLLKHSVN